MESLGLTQKDAQSRNKWRRRIKGQPAKPGSPAKMAIKTEYVLFLLDVVGSVTVRASSTSEAMTV